MKFSASKMTRRGSISIFVLLLLAVTAAAAQDSSAQPAPAQGQDSSQAQPQITPPSPAYGQSGSAVPITENPPISGLDQPALGPHAAPLSYLQAGATVSETADTNVSGELGGSGNVSSVSRALGTLDLRRLWSHYDLALNYAGGVGYYNAKGIGIRSLQQLGFNGKANWKRGQFAVRDDFSYLPDGNFGTVYGSLSDQQSPLGLEFGQSLLGGSNFGALGDVPRLMNVAVADVTEALTPKSAFTAAGAYAAVHFYGGDTQLTGGPFLGSTQTTGQAGYDRILTPHDQVALIYGYQSFHFLPGGGSCPPDAPTCTPAAEPGTTFNAQVIEMAYAHRISGRFDFTIAAGPQIIQLSECTALFGVCEINTTYADTRLGVAGRALLRYRTAKTDFEASYGRLVTAGSGFFAGAESDIVHLDASRPLGRKWSGFTDAGFARNSRLEPANFGPVNANVYEYVFLGAGVHRMLGRSFHTFFSYQFNELSFDSSLCALGLPCNRLAQRHTGTIGLDWQPRPIRID